MKLLSFSIAILLSSMAQAQTLDKLITQEAELHNLDAADLYAILAVESSGGRNPATRRNRNGTRDVGVFQINSVHRTGLCAAINIDTTRGNVICAARVLKYQHRYAGKDPMWQGRFHSKTPSLKLKYYNKLLRAKLALADNK